MKNLIELALSDRKPSIDDLEEASELDAEFNPWDGKNI
jgi:hypothetical protein